MEKLTNLEGTLLRRRLRSDLERLQLSEEEAKIATGRVLSLQEKLPNTERPGTNFRSEKIH